MQESFIVGDIVTWSVNAQHTQREAIAQYTTQIGVGPTYTVTKLIDLDTQSEATKSTKYFLLQVDDVEANFNPSWFQKTN